MTTTTLIERTLCWESDRSCCSLYFRRDNEISAWGLSSVMLPAYCLTQGWPNVQWLWLLAASECTVFISWVQSPLLTQDWPHTPPASDYQCPISDIPSFIKALCVWATLPPVPILGNHHSLTASPRLASSPRHSARPVICALQFLISPSSLKLLPRLGPSALI